MSELIAQLFGDSGCFLNFLTALQYLPWYCFARHFTALLFYALALAQHPSSTFASTPPNSSNGLPTSTFTLLFWCACCYHYMVSAGRVDIDWINGQFRAHGWVVKSSRRMHRIILILSLAVSSASVVQTASLYSITENAILDRQVTWNLSFLKVDFFLSLLLALYAGIRLSLEPTGMIKRRRSQDVFQTRENGSHIDQAIPDDDLCNDVQSFLTPPDFAEECSICLQRIANRQTNCGHAICCCCLTEVMKVSDFPVSSVICPFCRQKVFAVREMCFVVSKMFHPLTEYCRCSDSEGVCTDDAAVWLVCRNACKLRKKIVFR